MECFRTLRRIDLSGCGTGSSLNSWFVGSSCLSYLVCYQNYTSRMNKTGRPVSPHVTIYAMPVGALSSITNRVTGVALSLGAAGLGFIEIVAGSGTSLELMQTIGSQGFLIPAGAKCKLSGLLREGFVCYGILLT
jgi:hypothetical protein